MIRKKTSQSTEDSTNTENSNQVEASEPKVFGWVVGKPASEQEHPDTK